MYRVELRHGWNGVPKVIHSEHLNGLKLLDISLVKDEDAIDGLDFKIDPTNPAYIDAQFEETFVTMKNVKKNKLLFDGRVMMPNDGMENSGALTKEVNCEGLMAILNDSVQEYWKSQNNTVPQFIQHILDVHNKQVTDSYKKVKIGRVDVSNSTNNVYRYVSDTETTWETLNDKLVNRLGGHLRLRHEADGLYLDYLKELGSESNQEIKLGKNLLSIKRSFDPSEFWTVIKPTGASIQSNTGNENQDKDESGQVSTPRVNIKTVNNGSPFLVNTELANQYGWRVAKSSLTTWGQVNDPKILLSKAKELFNKGPKIKEQFQINAVDMSMFDPDSLDDFDIYNKYRIKSPIQGIDEQLEMVSLNLKPLAPESSTFNVGDKLLSQEDYSIQLEKSAKGADDLKNVIQNQNDSIGKLQDDSNRYKDDIQRLQDEIDALKNGNGDVGKIIDVSEWQGVIDFNAIKADGVGFVIIRVQSGSTHQDMKYMENIHKAQTAGLKYAVYAYAQYISDSDAKTEATDFYNRTQTAVGSGAKPVFYMIDCEEQSASNMRTATQSWNAQMSALGVSATNQVAYIANHLYDQFNIDVAKFGSIVVPSYGANDGTIANSTKPTHPYDLWQYTSVGKVNGISGNVDMNTDPSTRFKNQYL